MSKGVQRQQQKYQNYSDIPQIIGKLSHRFAVAFNKIQRIQLKGSTHKSQIRPVACEKSQNTQDNEQVLMGGLGSIKIFQWFPREFDIIFFCLHFK